VDFRSENVANAQADPSSIYQIYRRLIAARRASAALALGSYRPVVARGDLIVYVRASDRELVLVALNLSGEPIAIRFAQKLQGRVLVSCFADRDGEMIDDGIELRAHEGLVIALAPDAAARAPSCSGTLRMI
jgi:alpha-glucosidase